MTEWKYYYLDENDNEAHASGLFQLTRADISQDNTFDETVSFGSINLDFKDGEIAGIEIYQDAEKIITPAWREGTVENPKTLKIDERESSRSLIDKLKEIGVIRE